MPMVDGKYVAPTWNNGGSPAINATELQAMSNTIYKGTLYAEVVGYYGTGNSGADYPCSITFTYPVDVIIMVEYGDVGFNPLNESTNYAVVMAEEDTDYQQKHGFTNALSASRGKRSSDNKTYYWYNSNASSQYNNSGKHFMFIGFRGGMMS